MKSNEDLKLMSIAIKAVIAFNGEPAKKTQLGRFCVSLWLHVVDKLHDKGMHQMAHKLDDAVCVAVERFGVAA